MKNYRAARKRVSVSVGESVRLIRELQGLSQNELAQRTGISQARISGIENSRVKLGVERAKVLAQDSTQGRCTRRGSSRLRWRYCPRPGSSLGRRYFG